MRDVRSPEKLTRYVESLEETQRIKEMITGASRPVGVGSIVELINEYIRSVEKLTKIFEETVGIRTKDGCRFVITLDEFQSMVRPELFEALDDGYGWFEWMYMLTSNEVDFFWPYRPSNEDGMRGGGQVKGQSTEVDMSRIAKVGASRLMACPDFKPEYVEEIRILLKERFNLVLAD